jgi:hypothetical protein
VRRAAAREEDVSPRVKRSAAVPVSLFLLRAYVSTRLQKRQKNLSPILNRADHAIDFPKVIVVPDLHLLVTATALQQIPGRPRSNRLAMEHADRTTTFRPFDEHSLLDLHFPRCHQRPRFA